MAALVLGAVTWFALVVLLKVALVSFGLVVALLLAALLEPGAGLLRRLGLPPALAAVVSVLVLLGVPVGVGLLLYSRVSHQISDLRSTVTAGLDDVRSWLTTGPLSLDPAQVGRVRDSIVGYISEAMPSIYGGALTVLHVLGGVLLAVFALFFLVKDGERMWRWALGWTPARHRERVDGAGRQAWTTLKAYVQGTVVIALVDAVLIGAGLFFLDVPLWLSLTLLIFLGAFVPLLGATLAGAAAVLVTLVSNGFGDALIVLAIVLVVQQVEGNVLQPLVMGRAVSLHPLVILVAVTCGTILLGIPGAVLAVPVVAVAYQVTKSLTRSG